MAGALRAGCLWLLSEDLQDGQQIFGTTVISPFTHTPDEIES